MNALNYAREPEPDPADPPMTELLARLATLREEIRRARQRYGLDERQPANGGESADGADEQ